jgi:betaine reductase
MGHGARGLLARRLAGDGDQARREISGAEVITHADDTDEVIDTISDRDSVPGEAIAECLSSAGAEVVMVQTECFV